ncbi:hypothetical protein K2D_26140 [Enterococcus hirae]|uniref:DUF1642 domain-containing protein n=1 Tax=Enterococcus hirae TaxID=1354 RepID=UPI00244D80A3|nr:DUF1642 domain-containing protein [Enterococcus hirae]GMB99537.1 hypothetical protein K2D_26140 [Enterococcus hirae]GMC07550.1 hypothetical protein K4F_25560 [Enterococcus hirae]
MNKQEGIKELESLKMKSKSIRSECYNSGLNAGITILNKLDEPQKPVVPKFVADWFEDNKRDLDNAIFGYIVFWEERDTDSVLYQWFAKSKNKPIETLIRMKDGYEVEKEPLYYVKIPSLAYDMFLVKGEDGELIVFQNTSCGTKFTEAEIKAIDERYWAFAVPLEEVTEG